MIEIIGRLMDKGFAYQSGKDVYFEVEKFADYGKLSGRRLEDMLAGARVEVDVHKRNPLDFVLWKGSKPGEPSWDSPWGPGRPGWHIECSAMGKRYLGATFDIHGGGAKTSSSLTMKTKSPRAKPPLECRLFAIGSTMDS